MTDPTKEEQFKAAIAQAFTLMAPDVTLIVTDTQARRLLTNKLKEVFVVAVQSVLNEITEEAP